MVRSAFPVPAGRAHNLICTEAEIVKDTCHMHEHTMVACFQIKVGEIGQGVALMLPFVPASVELPESGTKIQAKRKGLSFPGENAVEEYSHSFVLKQQSLFG